MIYSQCLILKCNEYNQYKVTVLISDFIKVNQLSNTTVTT